MAWVARRKMKVGDGYRWPDDLVPEAEHWTHRDAWVSQGRLEWVDDEGAGTGPPSHAGGGAGDPAEGSPAPFDYDDLTIDEVKQAFMDGDLDADEIDRLEGQREQGRRVGVDDFLLELQEADEE